MKLSTRNQIAGTVQQVHAGEAMATVKVELGGGEVITAAITAEAVTDLGLEPGFAVPCRHALSSLWADRVPSSL